MHVFRGSTFVIAFDGEVVADGRFAQIVQDLNLLASLGVRLVLVHGTRPQIDALMEERGLRPRYVRDIRVTDEATLKCVKEANGRVRLEIEALLSMGLPNSPMANSTIRVASGNFIVARPRGVLDGVDLQYSGEVRKVNADMLQARLVDGEIALVSPLGYSPTGEIFNLTVEDVAAAVAVALHADKLIFLLEGPGIANAKGTAPARAHRVRRRETAGTPDTACDRRAALPAAGDHGGQGRCPARPFHRPRPRRRAPARTLFA